MSVFLFLSVFCSPPLTSGQNVVQNVYFVLCPHFLQNKYVSHANNLRHPPPSVGAPHSLGISALQVGAVALYRQ
jgi:hypothetical protein